MELRQANRAERSAGQDLDAWLAAFLAAMGRKTRRTGAPLYLRGLLGPGDRKSLQPMAARLGLPGHDQMHHFIASPAWDDSLLWTELARSADRVGDGPVWGNNRHLPGDEVWLVGEWRASGERKYDLFNLPPRTTRRALAGTIRARWVCEQAHQQLKEELGLDHLEGRSWTGLHRHALMTCIACAYLQHLRLARPERVGRGKKVAGLPGPPPSPSLPAVRQAIIGRLFVAVIPPVRCPHCRRRFRLPSDLKVPR